MVRWGRRNGNASPLTAGPDLLPVLQEMVDVAIAQQGADFGAVRLYDEETGTLSIAAHRGLNSVFLV